MQRGMQTGPDGPPRAFWAETGPDHLRHAHNYPTVAADLVGNDMRVSYVRQGPMPGPGALGGEERKEREEEYALDSRGSRQAAPRDAHSLAA
jgi:hypothetical protein